MSSTESRSELPNEQSLTALLKLAFPLVISFCFRSLFSLVDTVYASFLSDDAIAAIGLAVPFEFVMIAIWVGVSTGLTSYLSKGIVSDNPANDYDIYVRSARTLLLFVIPLFALIGVGIYLFAPYLNLAPGVRDSFRTYGSVLLIGSAITGFWSIIPDSIVKAHHDTRSTMIAGMLSNIANVCLNTLFLFVFHWGIFGIAFSTVIGRLAGLSYAIWRARTLEAERKAKLSPEAYKNTICSCTQRVALKRMLTLSIPSALTYSLISLEGLFVNFLLAGLSDSTSALAAYSIYHRISFMALMPMIATSVAVLPFVARGLQRGAYQQIGETFRGVMAVAFGYCLFFVLPVLLLWSKDIVAAFTETETMIAYGQFALWLVIPMCFFSIPTLFSKSLLEGFQRGRPVLVLAVLRHVAFGPTLCVLGMAIAPAVGYTGFAGLMFGLLGSVALASFVALYISRQLFAEHANSIP